MNILVVDDSIESRRSVARFLEDLGHLVMQSGDGQEALAKLQREKIQMVFSDVRMPRMDGFELLDRIKNSPELKDLMVVLFTGHGDVKDAVEAMRNGAYDYLLKPVDVNELHIITERIQEYLVLKEQNKTLTDRFDQAVQDATDDIRKDLEDLRMAYAQEVGTAQIGIYSDKIREVFKTAKRLHKKREIPVLIEGETGTGKEIVARFIHYGRGDVTSPFVAINCAAISPNLFESELFGYEAGAFTGGNPKGQKGKIELAREGTIFLDEIGEMAPDYQAKLLRVIQEGEFYRLGGLKKITSDVRVICATNKDVRKGTADGTFRQDLYYRLNIGFIKIPPLRERPEEILPLAEMFVFELYNKNRTRFQKISPEAAKILEGYDWPGNVRELNNTIERAALLWDDVELQPSHLDFLLQPIPVDIQQNGSIGPPSFANIPLPEESLDLNEWSLDIVERALKKYSWNKSRTAEYLGITRSVLYTFLERISKRHSK
jgi:two-component system, NtrC family, response regulator AtoC